MNPSRERLKKDWQARNLEIVIAKRLKLPTDDLTLHTISHPAYTAKDRMVGEQTIIGRLKDVIRRREQEEAGLYKKLFDSQEDRDFLTRFIKDSLERKPLNEWEAQYKRNRAWVKL